MFWKRLETVIEVIMFTVAVIVVVNSIVEWLSMRRVRDRYAGVKLHEKHIGPSSRGIPLDQI